MKLTLNNLINVAPRFKYSAVYFNINNSIIDNDLKDYGLNYIKIYAR